jgi:hypothetical protein
MALLHQVKTKYFCYFMSRIDIGKKVCPLNGKPAILQELAGDIGII